MAKRNAQEAESISKWADWHSDYFQGTKPALIAGGMCKAHWFPEKLVPMVRKDGKPYRANNGKSQRLQRTYRPVEGTELTYRTDAYRNEFWIVRIAVSQEEAQLREQESRRKLDERERKDEAPKLLQEPLDHAAVVRRRVAALPAFDAATMTDGEKYLVRIMRGLTDHQWECSLEMAEVMLTGKSHANLDLPRLQLVVDNDASK